MFMRRGLLFLLTLQLIGDSKSARVPAATTDAGSGSEIAYEIQYFIKVYKNGTVERLIGTGFVPPSIDPETGVQSKDVLIAPKINISARVFLPKIVNATHKNKLPVLVYYFHGGAFCTGSAFNPTYHNYLNSLVAEAKVVGVSVNYRLTPEHLLPIGYEDSWTALKWVFSHKNGSGEDEWLNKYADFRRVYLGGDSAGGNIAHNIAMRAGLEKSDVVLEGMFLNCPHFWGKKLFRCEARGGEMRTLMESIWIRAYPDSPGFDDPLVNPAKDPNLSKLGCRKVLVYVAQNDILKQRGWYYKKALSACKWNGFIKVVEVMGEGHVFNLNRPDNPKAIEMLKNVGLFLNQGIFGWDRV